LQALHVSSNAHESCILQQTRADRDDGTIDGHTVRCVSTKRRCLLLGVVLALVEGFFYCLGGACLVKLPVDSRHSDGVVPMNEGTALSLSGVRGPDRRDNLVPDSGMLFPLMRIAERFDRGLSASR